MALHQVRHAVQDAVPLLVGGYGAKLAVGKLQGQVHLPGVSGVHHQAVGRAVGRDPTAPHQEARHLLDGALGGRQADAGHGAVGQGAEPLHRQAEVGATLVAGHGVELVQDQRPHRAEGLAAALGRQQDVEGLGGGDEHVGRTLGHLLPLGGRGVACADGHPDLGQRRAAAFGNGADLGQGLGQVPLDVVGQRLQGRHVHHLGGVGKAAVQTLAHEAVQACEEGGQGLPRARGGGYEGVAALGDGWPSTGLGLGGRLEPTPEPGLHQRVKRIVRHPGPVLCVLPTGVGTPAGGEIVALL